MGLLDDLLGGLAGQAMGGRAQQEPTQAGMGGGGMSSILVALMPVVLGMLANRSGQGSARNPGAFGQARGGGGLTDILGQVLGGAGGGGAAGGLGGLLDQLQRTGFGEQANSWVSRGANQPIPPDAMSQIFGRDGLEQISRQAGLSEEDTSRGLSQLLPEVVDHMTPEGDVPDFGSLTSSVDDLARRFGVR
jgi:uncharacterized protein YidB (DUF937 family)